MTLVSSKVSPVVITFVVGGILIGVVIIGVLITGVVVVGPVLVVHVHALAEDIDHLLELVHLVHIVVSIHHHVIVVAHVVAHVVMVIHGGHGRVSGGMAVSESDSGKECRHSESTHLQDFY